LLKTEKKEPRYFVNPVILNKDPIKNTHEEGCLSVPEQFAEIDRPSKCDVEYLDYNGKKQLLKADGLLATCIQHEMDHLEGILFIDYLSKLKKSMIIKKLSKLKSNTCSSLIDGKKDCFSWAHQCLLYPILKSLYQNGYPISDVYTQPPQKSQRGQKINKSPIQGIAETLNLDFRTPKNLKDNNEEYEYFKSIDADLAIVVAYGQIIPKEFLNLTKKGFINIHASLLPKWRGAAPIQRSIMNLDKETGVSVMKIAEQLDTGPVCNTYKIDLTNNLNAIEVSEKLSLIAAEKILDNVDDIMEDKAKFIEQDHSKATYASKIQKAEGEINWNDEAKIIIGKINGLYPAPGAFFIYKGERYKILKAEIGNGIGKPGEIVSDYLEIVCGDKQTIKIKEIQRQGKKPQNIGEFMLGSQIKKGAVI
jgi:methionyl-tRNA formyltransferase